MKMRCYRKILRISYKDHTTNEEVRAKIQQAIRLHEDLLTIVKGCKLQWYGHVSRLSRLAKTCLLYTSDTKTMLPTRNSMPKSCRHLDHTKTS